MKLFALVTAVILLLLANSILSAAPPTQTPNDPFELVSCDAFKLSDDEFLCGYVRVPELHAQPNGRQLKLAVAILPGTVQTPDRGAFVVAQGGPGGSTLDTFGSFFAQGLYPAIDRLRAERDIVLYDQRGTLYAQPALRCPEELENTFATIEQELPPAESLRLSEQAALKCRERLVREGINLAAYNSIENALDLEDVRRALGYEKFDLYGVSYGTLLALHALRETPDTFRSIVLDAVVPAQTNPNSAVAESQNRAFEQLFARCTADADCNRAYPNLKQVFYAQVEAFNQKPARVRVVDDTGDGATGRTFNAALNGDDFINLLFQFIYNSELVPLLPQMIYDARAGRYTLIEAFFPIVLFDRTFATGMYYSVMCAEDADFTVNDLKLDEVDPHIAETQTRDTAAFLQLCQKWEVPPLGASADAPVRSNVPTLIFSGNFDPITPPANGETAADTISPSYVYEFPAYGHGAMTSGNCPNAMIAAFVRNPDRAPDASCIASQATNVRFVTPSNTILAAGIGKIQLAMLQGKVLNFIVPIVAVFLLLTVWVIGPLAWLIRRSQKRPSEPQLLARLTPWLIALASLSALAFFSTLFVLLIVVALRNENTITMVVGAPREWLLLYLMPLIYAVCALVIAVAVALAWRRSNWGIWRRVYFSVLAVAAVGLVVWFAWNGVLFAFIG